MVYNKAILSDWKCIKINIKINKKVLGSIAILIIFIIFLTVGYFLSKPKASIDSKDVFVDSSDVVTSESSQNNSKSTGNAGTIKVEIKGQVKCPGVYELASGSRVEDLVIKAGGFTSEADSDSIVQVKRLKDEDCIIVRKKGEQINAESSASSINSDGKVNINTATKDELDKIPGIGPVTAEKIIGYREKNGDYKSIEDLKKIGGIGDKTLDKFKDKIDIR